MNGNNRTRNTPTYLRASDAARYTGISQSTLSKLRMHQNRTKGPSFLRVLGSVVYRREDLDAWMNSHLVE